MIFSLVLLAGLALGGCGDGSAVMREGNQGLPPGDGFMTKELATSHGPRKYTIFIPASYTPTKKWPAIVFLHGVGEGGSDATANVGVGLGPAVAKRAATFPFIVIFPQSSSGYWDENSDAAADAIATLEQVKKDYAVDPDRVSLTGLSTGGYGVWGIGAKWNSEFAALVPMCAYSPHEKDLPTLAKLPVWAFHNGGDMFVFAAGSSWACKEINKLGGHAKYTEFGAIGHNCWDEAYNEGELFSWMLDQRRGGGTAGSGTGQPGAMAKPMGRAEVPAVKAEDKNMPVY